jgi:flagellar biosynthesis GTPase FlhF
VLLLYAYCVGIPSSRRIERACWEDAAFRVLTGNQQPDHSRISDFRLVHLDALADLFVQVLRLCQKAGLVSLGNVALDGTKVKANASKHKAMSHERMLKSEAQLVAEIAALLRKAELIDAQEDARYGKGKRGDELPKELELRQDRLDALRKAKAELEAEAAADDARRREQQARAAEEQAAEAAAQVADAEAATVAADNDKADAEREAAAQALAKEAQQAERRAKAARGRAELARRLAIDKAQAADLSSPDPLVNRHAESPHCRHEKVLTFLGSVSTLFGGGLGLLNSPGLVGMSHSSGVVIGDRQPWLGCPDEVHQASLAGGGDGTSPAPAKEEPATGRISPDLRFSLSR